MVINILDIVIFYVDSYINRFELISQGIVAS